MRHAPFVVSQAIPEYATDPFVAAEGPETFLEAQVNAKEKADRPFAARAGQTQILRDTVPLEAQIWMPS